MTRTAFYALDQERLPRQEWDLADSFARLHEIVASDASDGVVRITVADLMLVLEAWNLVDDPDEYPRHGNAVARIAKALE
jgi:hypothetical protein